MIELSILLLVLIIANLAVDRRPLTIVTLLLLSLTNAVLLILGTVIRLGGLGGTVTGGPVAPASILVAPQAGTLLIATGLVAYLPLLPAVRRTITAHLPLDPDHPVHTTALVYAIYLVGGTIAQFAVDISQLLAETGAQLTLVDVWLQGAFFAAAGFIGVGLLTRRSLHASLRRLSLTLPTTRQVALALTVMLAFQALDFGVSYVWFTVDPASYRQLADLTGSLFEPLMTPVGALSIGLTAGIGEELLFRGALQPRFGLWVTSLLFALGHTQYAISPALFEVFLIGLILGVIRNRTNTTTTILIHVTYNTVNVLLAPLWPG